MKIFPAKFLFEMMIKREYDIIVSYLEGPTTRIVSGCTNKKTILINWVHTELTDLREFTKSYRNLKEMKKCYLKYKYTIFVSKEAEIAFNKVIKVDSKVIRNVIDANYIIKKSKEEVNSNIKNNNKIKVITSGRLIKVKGYDRLLEIHRDLLREGHDYNLYILGEGKERKRLEEYIKNNNLEQNTKLLGFKENPYKYINSADIYVCSSYKEGYNTAIIEALILQKPILTTKCSGMNDILENGKYGIIVENNKDDLYKGLKKLITDENKRKKYKLAAIKRSKDFTIYNQIKKIEKLFE